MTPYFGHNSGTDSHGTLKFCSFAWNTLPKRMMHEFLVLDEISFSSEFTLLNEFYVRCFYERKGKSGGTYLKQVIKICTSRLQVIKLCDDSWLYGSNISAQCKNRWSKCFFKNIITNLGLHGRAVFFPMNSCKKSMLMFGGQYLKI